jgi:hypothetical protein
VGSNPTPAVLGSEFGMVKRFVRGNGNGVFAAAGLHASAGCGRLAGLGQSPESRPGLWLATPAGGGQASASRRSRLGGGGRRGGAAAPLAVLLYEVRDPVRVDQAQRGSGGRSPCRREYATPVPSSDCRVNLHRLAELVPAVTRPNGWYV